MHARSTTVQVHPSSIDAQVAHVRDDVMPALRATDGCIGLSMLVNRVSGRCIATSAWQSEEAMHATEHDRVVAVDGIESVRGDRYRLVTELSLPRVARRVAQEGNGRP